MIYLDRELVKTGRELLFKEPVYLRENDSDIKVMFNIKNLDIHFKDNKIYYKISIVGENYSYTSEQQLLNNGMFILDIPDDVPVGNYMMLVSLIDSEFDSIITLNPVNEFIIVEESINLTPDEPVEPEVPTPEEIKLYLIENNVLTGGEFVKEKEYLFSECSVNNNVITNNAVYNNESIDIKDAYYVTYGSQKNGYILLTCNSFSIGTENKLILPATNYYKWSEETKQFVFQNSYPNGMTFAQKLNENLVTNSEIAYNYFLDHPDYASNLLYEKSWSSKKITSCILKWDEILDLSNYNELILSLECSSTGTIIDPLSIRLKQEDTMLKELKLSDLPLTALSINLEDIENKNNVELEVEILGDNTELTIKDLYFKGVIIPGEPEEPVEPEEPEPTPLYIINNGDKFNLFSQTGEVHEINQATLNIETNTISNRNFDLSLAEGYNHYLVYKHYNDGEYYAYSFNAYEDMGKYIKMLGAEGGQRYHMNSSGVFEVQNESFGQIQMTMEFPWFATNSQEIYDIYKTGTQFTGFNTVDTNIVTSPTVVNSTISFNEELDLTEFNTLHFEGTINNVTLQILNDTEVVKEIPLNEVVDISEITNKNNITLNFVLGNNATMTINNMYAK